MRIFVRFKFALKNYIYKHINRCLRANLNTVYIIMNTENNCDGGTWREIRLRTCPLNINSRSSLLIWSLINSRLCMLYDPTSQFAFSDASERILQTHYLWLAPAHLKQSQQQQLPMIFSRCCFPSTSSS